MTSPWLVPDVCRLDQVATIDREGVAASAIEHGTTYVGLENIDSDGAFVDVRPVSQGELASNKFLFGPHHILFGKLRPYLRKTARPHFEGVCSTDIVPILPGPRIDRDYLFHFLRHPKTVEQAVMRCEGANLPRLSPKDLSNFRVPVPTLVEQRRIAGILDKADTVRRKRKQAIALTDELLRSTFLDMFGDPVTNPKGWDVRSLGQLLGFLTSGSRGWARYYADSGDLFLRIQNVKHDRLDLDDVAFVQAPESAEARRTLTSPGDVLLSITADLGRTSVVPADLKRAFINQHLAIMRPVGVNADYLSTFLASEGGQRQFRRLNKGGVKAGLNFDDIRSVKVVVPPLAAQLKFAHLKARFRRLEMEHASSGHEGARLFDSLVHLAFPQWSKAAESTC